MTHPDAAQSRPPVDPDATARERRRRRRRLQAGLGGVVVAVALVALALSILPLGPSGSPDPVELTDVPTDAPTPTPSGAATTQPPADATSPAGADPDAPAATGFPATGGATVWFGPGGLVLSDAGTDGARVLFDGPVRDAHVVDEGVVFQPEGAEEIRVTTFDGAEEVAVPAVADEPVVLRGARTTPDGVVVLLSRFPPAPDDAGMEGEEVILTRVIGGDEREIGRYPTLELITEAVTWDADGVIAATCHLACSLRRVPTAAGGEVEPVLPADALPWARILAVRAREDRYVVVTAGLGEDATGEDPLELVEVDIASGQTISRTPLGIGGGAASEEFIGRVALHDLTGPAGDGRAWVVSATRVDRSSQEVVGIDVVAADPTTGEVTAAEDARGGLIPLGG